MITLHWAWFVLILFITIIIILILTSYFISLYTAKLIFEVESNRISPDHVKLELDKIISNLNQFDYNGDFTYEYSIPSLIGYNYDLINGLMDYTANHNIKVEVKSNSIETIYKFIYKISK